MSGLRNHFGELVPLRRYHSIAPRWMDYILDRPVCEGLGKIRMEGERRGETKGRRRHCLSHVAAIIARWAMFGCLSEGGA